MIINQNILDKSLLLITHCKRLLNYIQQKEIIKYLTEIINYEKEQRRILLKPFIKDEYRKLDINFDFYYDDDKFGRLLGRQYIHEKIYKEILLIVDFVEDMIRNI